MKDKKTAVYCILLAVFIFAGAVLGFAGEAQARYSDMIFFSTVVESEKTEISSDVLAKETEAGIIVMLGEIKDSRTFEFSVTASGGERTENLVWSFPEGIVSVSAVMSEKKIVPEGETEETEEKVSELSSGMEINVREGTETKIIMTVVPVSETAAFGEEIVVSFGELRGRFSFDIPQNEEEVPGEEEKADGTVPTEPEIGESGNEASGGTAGTVESPAVGEIDILPHFDPKGKLPMKVDIPEGAHYVKIGFYNGEKTSPLPEGTRISLNGGSDFYVIPESEVPEFSVSKITYSEGKYMVLLDFEKTEFSLTDTVTVVVEAYSENGIIGTYMGEAVPDISGAGMTVLENGVSVIEIGEGEEPAEEPEYYVLSGGDAIRISFPEEWENYAGSGYSIQMLRTAENETVGYNRIESAAGSLWVEYAGEEGNADLILRIGETLPPAGKYQAIIQWNFNEICFYKKQITFFINYSTDIYSTFGS